MKRRYRLYMFGLLDPATGSQTNERTFRTLREARAFARLINGGRLHGKWEGGDCAIRADERIVEGWNLSRHEGCDEAIITRIAQ